MERLKRIAADYDLHGGSNDLALTYPGVETFLLFDTNFPLREFAAFEVCLSEASKRELEDSLLHKVIEKAQKAGALMLLEAPTWRASPDFLKKLKYDETELFRVNEAAVLAQKELQKKWALKGLESVVGAEIGPRGDGYVANDIMTIEEAENYHQQQVQALKRAGVEMVTAYTMTNLPEATGIAKAAAKENVPIAVSVTVETNGKLPDDTSVEDLIQSVDQHLKESSLALPLYYMINCAHPEHIHEVLAEGKGKEWRRRLKGLRSNASNKSHDELDEMQEIDNGNPVDLGKALAHYHLNDNFPIVGGCCGTDHRHIEEILKHCQRL
mmetsp:Transcript_1339/g.1461  ORF Transcript_1339/g.1461 Transcript_1339/m.1461 type:complete len:326 (+) Transcript_1339:221-1198(+)